jgi:hypothetical protein
MKQWDGDGAVQKITKWWSVIAKDPKKVLFHEDRIAQDLNLVTSNELHSLTFIIWNCVL